VAGEFLLWGLSHTVKFVVIRSVVYTYTLKKKIKKKKKIKNKNKKKKKKCNFFLFEKNNEFKNNCNF
jgi:hypothetical protein